MRNTRQMSRRAPNRLELHRLKKVWHASLNLSYEFLDPSDLSIDESQQLADAVFNGIRMEPEKDKYQIYFETLNYWGITCPHPQEKRLYSGKKRYCFQPLNQEWFMCECCKCAVIENKREVYNQKFLC